MFKEVQNTYLKTENGLLTKTLMRQKLLKLFKQKNESQRNKDQILD